MAKNYSKLAAEVVTLATDENFYDSTTHAMKTIEYEHYEIHDGSAFSVHIDNTTENSDDDRTFIGFETPDTTKWLHIVIRSAASSPAEVFLVETVTIDDDEGTRTAVSNRNRNSGTASTVIPLESQPVVGNVTVMIESQLAGAQFSYTTLLYHIILIAGEGPKAIGGETRAVNEWILKQGTKYGIFIQNIGANANRHELQLNWYEHTNIS